MLKPFYSKKGHLGMTTREVKEALQGGGGESLYMHIINTRPGVIFDSSGLIGTFIIINNSERPLTTVRIAAFLYENGITVDTRRYYPASGISKGTSTANLSTIFTICGLQADGYNLELAYTTHKYTTDGNTVTIAQTTSFYELSDSEIIDTVISIN